MGLSRKGKTAAPAIFQNYYLHKIAKNGVRLQVLDQKLPLQNYRYACLKYQNRKVVFWLKASADF